MTANLPDTNVILLAMGDPGRLSGSIRQALEAGPNILSVLSYWEVLLKSMKGRLDVGDPRTWWERALLDLDGTVLPLNSAHVAAIASLPAIHQDPFDRALIAQASVERLTLLTTDRVIHQYTPIGVHVVG